MFDLPAKALGVRDQVEAFFDARILPNPALWQQQAARATIPDIEKTLRAEAKALGLWNMALPSR